MKKAITCMLIIMLFYYALPSVSFASSIKYNSDDNTISVLNKGDGYFKEIISRFSDMGTHWADVTVGKLVELGVIDGYGDETFKPNNTITRAEFVKMVRTSLKQKIINGNSFKDTEKHWAKNEVHTLVINYGIDKREYGDNFEPNKNITRIEMAKIILKSLELGGQAEAKLGVKTSFSDDNSILDGDKGYVIIASEYGIINGYPDKTFKPNGEATRAEASQIIVNMLNATIKEGNVPDKVVKDGFLVPTIEVEYANGSNEIADIRAKNEGYRKMYDAGTPYQQKIECLNDDKLNYATTIGKKGLEQMSLTGWRDINYEAVNVARAKFLYKPDELYIIDLNKVLKYKISIKSNKGEIRDYFVDIDPKKSQLKLD